MDITPEVDMTDYEEQGCMHEMFIRQAEKTPNNVAVITDKNEKVGHHFFICICKGMYIKYQISILASQNPELS